MNALNLFVSTVQILFGIPLAAHAVEGIAIPGGAHASTYIISQPGTYHLAGNFFMTNRFAHAIKIVASDVTLDLNGFAVTFADGDVGTGIGISVAAGGGSANVEIRDGSIVETPGLGIRSTIQGLRVVDIRVVAAGGSGIETSEGSVVDRCRVSYCGGSGIVVRGPDSAVTRSVVSENDGNGVVSEGALVAGNVVSRNSGSGIVAGDGSLVRDNLVRENNLGCHSDRAGIQALSRAHIRGNTLMSNCGAGILLGGGSGTIVEENAIESTSVLAATSKPKSGGVLQASSVSVGVRVEAGIHYVGNNRFHDNGVSVQGAFAGVGNTTF